MKLRNTTQFVAAIALATAGVGGAVANHHAMANPMVGGAEMFPAKPIAVNASAAPNLTTLVAAVKAAGLVETLASPGPFTVFAPTNDAFGKLPAGTVETLVMPENKATLTSILTYHVVAGKITSKNIVKAIKAGRGTATFKTVAGGTLKAKMMGSNVVLIDTKGGMSKVSQVDVIQSNGVVHIIDSVLLP